MQLRIGMLGGSFNPPHMAHLLVAQEAVAQLGLDLVVWVPVGRPPHRGLDDPGAEVRYELTELAIQRDPRFSATRAEIDRPGVSYTVDTLNALREEHPGAELVLILGGDEAVKLGEWRDQRQLVSLATLAVAERGQNSAHRIGQALRRLPGTNGRVEYLKLPGFGISSTRIRLRVARGEPIHYWVPDAVGTRIAELDLYRSEPAQ